MIISRAFPVLTVLAAAAVVVIAACSGNDVSQQDASQQTGNPSEQAAQPQQSAAETVAPADQPTEPLKLGFLLDFSGPLADYGPELQRGFDLAIQHINEAGGVWGMPVQSAVGDTMVDPTIAVEEARRLVEIEEVHALVGPMASGMALAVAESVTGPAGIPTISPVATSAQITVAEDDDFLFRVSLADHVEGRYLAQLAAQQGFDNVGLLYRDDAFGQGMADAFEQHWSGTLRSIGVSPGATSFTAELEQSVEADAEALVLIAFPPETILILREALELAYYDHFVFGAPGRSTAVPEAIGGELLAGMRGTYVASAPENDSSRAWDDAFLAEYGEAPSLPYVKEAYDATIALALAAQAAGSTDGTAIRDQLRRIGSAPGLIVIPTPDSLAAGLAEIARGGDVDYEGAAVSADWDENGDSTHGYIGIWEFSADNTIADVEVIEYTKE